MEVPILGIRWQHPDRIRREVVLDRLAPPFGVLAAADAEGEADRLRPVGQFALALKLEAPSAPSCAEALAVLVPVDEPRHHPHAERHHRLADAHVEHLGDHLSVPRQKLAPMHAEGELERVHRGARRLCVGRRFPQVLRHMREVAAAGMHVRVVPAGMRMNAFMTLRPHRVHHRRRELGAHAQVVSGHLLRELRLQGGDGARLQARGRLAIRGREGFSHARTAARAARHVRGRGRLPCEPREILQEVLDAPHSRAAPRPAPLGEGGGEPRALGHGLAVPVLAGAPRVVCAPRAHGRAKRDPRRAGVARAPRGRVHVAEVEGRPSDA
mmetsp:Transcript_56135/g.162610  ORF Transcript_56135/g.162610 Transcript_56135/m.162610 type:complete len:326 (+) Transcript_56135:299-1276(+)